MIKAIETQYKGYRFRSRLEARWAVFFDAAGIEWEYEKEGFEFDDGTKYLPDFYLPTWNTWVEIKPKHLIADGWMCFPDPIDAEIAKKCRLLAEGTGNFVYLLTGAIGDNDYSELFSSMLPNLIFFPISDGFVSSAYGDDRQWFCACGYCGKVGIEYEGKSDRLSCGHNDLWGNKDKIDGCINAARSARFEYGETPNLFTANNISPKDEISKPLMQFPELNGLHKSYWTRIYDYCHNKNPQTAGLLKSSTFVLQKYGELLFIGFNSEFAKAKSEKEPHISLIKEAFNIAGIDPSKMKFTTKTMGELAKNLV